MPKSDSQGTPRVSLFQGSEPDVDVAAVYRVDWVSSGQCCLLIHPPAFPAVTLPLSYWHLCLLKLHP